MTPEQFLEFARVLPEPLLLVSGEGQILASNKPVVDILGLRRQELQGRKLFDFVTETTNKISTYLEACASSQAMVIGSLTLRKNDGQMLVCRCRGAVVQPMSAESSALILLRLENQALAINNFVLLNKKIDELAKEIQRRKQAEEALLKANEELEMRVEERTITLKETLNELQCAQTQLIQTEKMSSLGQVVAGIAHEINNPLNFVGGNLTYAQEYIRDLLKLIQLYQKCYPNPAQEIEQEIKVIELDFLVQDLTKLLSSMLVGTKRIQEIVKSLRSFSRRDEAELIPVNIHEGIDTTLMILEHRLQATNKYPEIKVIKEYGQLPLVECYPGQLNQVFMNIIANAIDSLEEGVGNLKSPLIMTQGSRLMSVFQQKQRALRLPIAKRELRVLTKKLQLGVRGTRSSYKVVIRDMKKDQTPTPCLLLRQLPQLSIPHPGTGEPTPQIYIRTELLDDHWAVITIADNGLGMNEQVRSKLFDPFFTTKPVGKGTGIGLSISYHIVVEKHGGQLSCLSAPQQGARFVIKIPVTSLKYKKLSY